MLVVVASLLVVDGEVKAGVVVIECWTGWTVEDAAVVMVLMVPVAMGSGALVGSGVLFVIDVVGVLLVFLTRNSKEHVCRLMMELWFLS